MLASFGHVRDLPAKDGSVDPEQDFAMLWEVGDKSTKHMSDIVRAVKASDKVILATDPDREGEAISWHVLEVLRARKVLKDKTVERVTFNAITKSAVRDAMLHPRELDQPLVDAYLARRALDYLVGFNLSPVLWRKLPGSRSAGRVQSVTLRLVCAREREIEGIPRQGILVDPSPHLRTAAKRRLRGAARRRRRAQDHPARRRHRRRGPRVPGRAGGGALFGDERRSEARQAPSLPRPFRTSTLQQGRVAQARLVAGPHHADRPEALRGA